MDIHKSKEIKLYMKQEEFEDTKGVIRIRKGQATIYKTYT